MFESFELVPFVSFKCLRIITFFHQCDPLWPFFQISREGRVTLKPEVYFTFRLELFYDSSKCPKTCTLIKECDVWKPKIMRCSKPKIVNHHIDHHASAMVNATNIKKFQLSVLAYYFRLDLHAYRSFQGQSRWKPQLHWPIINGYGMQVTSNTITKNVPF